MKLRKALAIAIASTVWGGAVGGGFSVLLAHASQPGAQDEAPARWPVEVLVPRDAGRPTLVMLVHPSCPCTRASVADLERLMASVSSRVSAVVLFALPDGAPEPATGALWASVSAIAGVTAIVDPRGAMAARFGARTSGQVVLYGESGDRLFQGGLTPSRGHEGDSAGADAIAALLRGEASARRTDVYGCALFAEGGVEE
jgi:hypothetical protein